MFASQSQIIFTCDHTYAIYIDTNFAIRDYATIEHIQDLNNEIDMALDFNPFNESQFDLNNLFDFEEYQI